MERVKIRNSNRDKKKDSERTHREWILTPPKSKLRITTSYKVSKLEQKLGYDYSDVDQAKILVNMKNQFTDKAFKYYGEYKYGKKMTRFDKMKKKDELEFEIKKNPIITQYKAADKILRQYLLAEAFFAMKKY